MTTSVLWESLPQPMQKRIAGIPKPSLLLVQLYLFLKT
jgi:hypothetical protein